MDEIPSPRASGTARSAYPVRRAGSPHSCLVGDNARLAACLTQDSSHVTKGSIGSHVSKIQTALFVVDGLRIERSEIIARRYGPATADAVLAFKTKRRSSITSIRPSRTILLAR
jgi:hypothetical protein